MEEMVFRGGRFKRFKVERGCLGGNGFFPPAMHSKVNPSWSTPDYWQGRFEQSDTPWQLNRASTVLMEAIGELESRGFSLGKKCVLSPGCGRGLDALEVDG